MGAAALAGAVSSLIMGGNAGSGAIYGGVSGGISQITGFNDALKEAGPENNLTIGQQHTEQIQATNGANSNTGGTGYEAQGSPTSAPAASGSRYALEIEINSSIECPADPTMISEPNAPPETMWRPEGEPGPWKTEVTTDGTIKFELGWQKNPVPPAADGAPGAPGQSAKAPLSHTHEFPMDMVNDFRCPISPGHISVTEGQPCRIESYRLQKMVLHEKINGRWTPVKNASPNYDKINCNAVSGRVIKIGSDNFGNFYDCQCMGSGGGPGPTLRRPYYPY